MVLANRVAVKPGVGQELSPDLRDMAKGAPAKLEFPGVFVSFRTRPGWPRNCELPNRAPFSIEPGPYLVRAEEHNPAAGTENKKVY